MFGLNSSKKLYQLGGVQLTQHVLTTNKNALAYVTRSLEALI